MGGMTGEQIYRNFKDGKGTNPLQGIAAQLVKLQNTYGDRAQSIKDLQSAMEAAWTGEAGASAQAGAGPLATALTESAGNMDTTVGSMQTQTEAWHRTANSVEPVPPLPEKPSPWTTGLKAAVPIAGPFMAAADLKSYQAGVEVHNTAAQHNVETFSAYAAHTNANSTFPRSYTVLEPSGASISVTNSAPGAIAADPSAVPGTGRGPAMGSGPVGTGGPVSGVAAGPVPNVSGPGAGGQIGAGTGSGSPTPGTPTGVAAAGPVVGGRGSTSTPSPGSGTRSSFPAAPANAGGGASRTGPGARGTSRGGGIGERAGSRLYGSAGRGATIDGAGGRPPGESPRGGIGGARGSGVALPGGAVAASEAVARGATSGGRGAGMAPMGTAGAGRGKGGEDEEHQRASFLQENDPDEVFIGDLGRTAPPVIGE